MSAETKDMYFVDKEELVVPPKHVCEAYGERIHRCMKGIQHLEIQEPLISESYVASGLVEKYLDQLCYLRCSNPLAVTEKYFANTLTYLHLSMNPNSAVCFLPQLSAQPLEALVLSNIPRNFTWMEFYDVKGRDVVFENLKSLALSFQRENKDNAKLDQRVPCYRLHFPRLSNLTIRNCPKNSELYFCQAYFKQLEKVKVWGSVDSLDAMKALGLKKASSFDVVVVDDNDSDDKRHKKVYELVGHYLRSVISPAKRLFVHANLDCIEYQPTDWSNLCFLALYDMVKFDQLLNFINGIPSLLSLYVLRASFEGILPDDSAVADDTDQESDSSDDATLADRLSSLFPSSTLTLAAENTEVVNSAGIKEFSLYFDEQPGYSDKFKAHVARYMAESLPSLQHLYVEPSLQYHLTKKNPETRTAVYKQQAQFSIRYADHWMHRAYVTNLISL
ncbi:hypothetical protein H4R99_000419 [Coemansia sp. RSA 1722]|nr:hypothetical protein H4R99_000419 [Coemansia sp. RSA 1722]